MRQAAYTLREAHGLGDGTDLDFAVNSLHARQITYSGQIISSGTSKWGDALYLLVTVGINLGKSMQEKIL